VCGYVCGSEITSKKIATMFCMRLFSGSGSSSGASSSGVVGTGSASTNNSKPIRSESWEETWGKNKEKRISYR